MPGMTKHCIAEQRTALYRFYDAQGELLYVGITNDPWRRWRQHVQEKPWYPQVKHQSVTWYDSKSAASKAETRAIRAERPEFNIAGALKPPKPFPFGRELAVIAAACCVLIPVVCQFGARWVPPLAQVELAAYCGGPIVILAFVMIINTSRIYRFGCWLNRNFGADYRRGESR